MRKVALLLVGLAIVMAGFTLGEVPAQAQPAFLVKDVNGTRTGGTEEWPFRTQFVDAGGILFFNAADGRTGTELWRTDGTAAGTWLVRDICPGVCSSHPVNMAAVGSEVFFSADDGEHGPELWKSDGTEAGTMMVADLVPGPVGAAPRSLQEVGGKLLFVPVGTTTGDGELWTSDGTAAGTTLLLDIEPGPAQSLPTFLGKLGSIALFNAWTSTQGRELWRTDGTAAGTSFVADLNPGTGDSLDSQPPYPGASYAAVSGGRLFFQAYDAAHGSELWVSDGTAAGTTLVKDIFPGPGTSTGSSSPYSLVPFGTGVAFRADDGTHGNELWVSDSTAAGTHLVLDINPGSDNSSPWRLAVAGGKIFFRATDGTHGYELWTSDGTPGGTAMVTDLNPGAANGLPLFGLSPFAAVGSTLVFYADDGVHGEELWKSDGTAAGTSLLADINPGAPPSFFFNAPSDGDRTIVSAGHFYFRAYTDADGFEVWTSDGTVAGTHKLKEINDQASAFLITYPGGIFGSPVIGALPGGSVLFGGDDGISGGEPWASDGTDAGTHQVADLWPGVTGSYPYAMTSLGSRVLFEASTSPTTFSLWASDGTAPGTVSLGNDSDPAFVTPLGGIALFAGPGTLLWKTDGTPGGTAALGPAVTLGGRPVPLGSSLLFQGAGGGQPGLWTTDGTAGGTGLVKAFPPVPDSPTLGPLAAAAGRVFFSAATGAEGRELWVSDGTPAGTTLVKDIKPGTGSGLPFAYEDDVSFYGPALAALGGSAVFAAEDGVHGQEIWVSNGTAAGTTLLADILPGAGSSSPAWVTAAAGRVFFAADDGVHGRELWVTDGTPGGTTLLDINPGAGSSQPTGLKAVGRVLLFSAFDPAHGRELWLSDGTAAGTGRVQDIAPGALSSSPLSLAVSGPGVYFAANDNTTGFELWWLPRTALGAALSATKTAAGGFYEGGTVTYTVVVTNNGRTLQPDASGPEMSDVLPAGLTLTGATATGGSVTTDVPTRTVTWNGAIAAGASVTITITATVQAGTLGTTLANQATIHWDADADGVNEATGVSDDPSAGGATDPTAITIGRQALDFYTLPPCRVIDTRTSTALLSGVKRTISVAGSCGVPADAKAVAANLTVIDATGNGNLVAWPAGTTQPGTSNVNFIPMVTRSNNAILVLGASGGVDALATVMTGGSVQLVLDVSGYFQ